MKEYIKIHEKDNVLVAIKEIANNLSDISTIIPINKPAKDKQYPWMIKKLWHWKSFRQVIKWH